MKPWYNEGGQERQLSVRRISSGVLDPILANQTDLHITSCDDSTQSNFETTSMCQVTDLLTCN